MKILMRKMKSKKVIFPVTAVTISLIIITVVSLVLLNYWILTPYVEKYKYERSWYFYQETPCTKPKELLQEMAYLATDVSLVLKDLGVPSIACYGTLIGVLRRGRVLPWDNNVDLCIMNEITTHNFQTIQEIFLTRDISIQSYDSWAGHYRFIRGNIEGFISVFTRCSYLAYFKFWGEIASEYERDDWDSPWLCPDGILPNAAQIINGFSKPIPSSFLTPPLPALRFEDRMINVSRKDDQILRYLYPHSWWLDIRPVGCRH